MLKNMRVFLAFRVFLYPGRKVATSFANITGITTRTRKLVNYLACEQALFRLSKQSLLAGYKLPWIFEIFNTKHVFNFE